MNVCRVHPPSGDREKDYYTTFMNPFGIQFGRGKSPKDFALNSDQTTPHDSFQKSHKLKK